MYEIRQFDHIRLRTTRNVRYWVADSGTPSPHGTWRVISIMNGRDLLVCKNGAVVLVPIKDVDVVGHDKSDHLKELINGQKTQSSTER